MYNYNYAKLLGKIKERGYTQEKLAKAIKISATTMNKRLNNELDFRQSEMKEILQVLGEPLSTVSSYFFVENLRKHK